MNDINKIMTFGEATELWGLADSTLRKLVTTDKLRKGIDYRKSGKRAWLITRVAMENVYGKLKDEVMEHFINVKNTETGEKYKINEAEYEENFSFDTRCNFEGVETITINNEYLTVYIPTEGQEKRYDTEIDDYVIIQTYKTYKEVMYKKKWDTWCKY